MITNALGPIVAQLHLIAGCMLIGLLLTVALWFWPQNAPETRAERRQRRRNAISAGTLVGLALVALTVAIRTFLAG